MGPSSSTSPDWERLVVSPSQAPTDRDLQKFSGSSTAVATEAAVTAPTPGTDIRIWHASLRRALATSCRPSSAARKRTARHASRSGSMIGGKSLLISQERADLGLETAALAGRHHEPECLHQPADLVGELGRDLPQPVPRRPQRASEHMLSKPLTRTSRKN